MYNEKLLDITDERAKRLDIQWFESFRRCTLLSSFGSYMDRFEKKHIRSFMRLILESVLENCKFNHHFEISAMEKKRCKLLMQCLVNAANRSKK